MGFVDVEFEFGKSKFDKELIKFIQFLYWLYLITSKNWKKEGKKKRPKILDFPLVKVATIISISLIVIIPFSLTLLEMDESQVVGEILLFFVFLIVAISLIFILILLFVYTFYLFFRLVRSLFKTARYIINFAKKELEKINNKITK